MESLTHSLTLSHSLTTTHSLEKNCHAGTVPVSWNRKDILVHKSYFVAVLPLIWLACIVHRYENRMYLFFSHSHHHDEMPRHATDPISASRDRRMKRIEC